MSEANVHLASSLEVTSEEDPRSVQVSQSHFRSNRPKYLLAFGLLGLLVALVVALMLMNNMDSALPGSEVVLAGHKLFIKLDSVFPRGLHDRFNQSMVNFVFLDKDGTQTPPGDFDDTDFKKSWRAMNKLCLSQHKNGKQGIHMVTATGQPYFMWKITVGKAPYAVLSGGNAWVHDGDQVGAITISQTNLQKLMQVEDVVANTMKASTKFYYMNKHGMYSRSGQNPTVDGQFFGYIARDESIKSQLAAKLNSSVGQDLGGIEILYVKHCGISEFSYDLINTFFQHLGFYFTTDFKELPDGKPVNGRVWLIEGSGQRMQAMIMLTGGYCEIAISAGDKSTGMKELVTLTGANANVLMGAGDSGNDVPLRNFVTSSGGYFVAAPTAALLEEFVKTHGTTLDYDKELFEPQNNNLTVPGLWFQLLQLWGRCKPALEDS